MVEGGAARKRVVTKRPITKKKTVVKKKVRSRRRRSSPLSRSVENKHLQQVYDWVLRLPRMSVQSSTWGHHRIMSLKNELLKFCKHRVAPRIHCLAINIYIYILPWNFCWCDVQLDDDDAHVQRTRRRWTTTTILKWTATWGTAIMKRHRKLKTASSVSCGDDVCRHRRQARDASRPIRRSAGLQAVCVSVRPINGLGNRRRLWPQMIPVSTEIDDSDVFAIVQLCAHFRDHSIVRQRRKKLVDGDGRRTRQTHPYEMWNTGCHTSDGAVLNRGGSMAPWLRIRQLKLTIILYILSIVDSYKKFWSSIRSGIAESTSVCPRCQGGHREDGRSFTSVSRV
jgi:hypothetical protein